MALLLVRIIHAFQVDSSYVVLFSIALCNEERKEEGRMTYCAYRLNGDELWRRK